MDCQGQQRDHQAGHLNMKDIVFDTEALWTRLKSDGCQ